MKNFIFSLFVIFICFQSYSQCSINPFIQNNYELDAKVLALREILNDPLDPDYDNPFLPEERYRPYLERLSALYENPHNSPMVDSLFNDFRIHVNWEYMFSTPFKRIVFGIDNNAPWIEDFKTTGISGVTELDDLMATYQFSIDYFIVLTGPGYTAFWIETSLDFLNVTALLDDFDAIPDLFPSETDVELLDRFNYTGILYYIYSEPVEVCDIILSGNQFEFVLYAGDCFAGCSYSESRYTYVTEDCEVLSTLENDLSKITLYPNPVSDKLSFSGNSSEIVSLQIFSVQGKLIRKLNNLSTEIDVSQLKAGMYFVKLISIDGKINNLKFIKE